MNSGGTSNGQIISALLLVGGSCIGGGMLALPVATGVNGFFPSLLIMALCWFCMTATALLFVEISLWFEEGAHVITMTSRLLGVVGKGLAWILYLFIGYASLVAYTAGSGAQLTEAWNISTGLPISPEAGCIIFALVFSFVIFLGSNVVGRVNSVLFIAMIVAYVGLFGFGVDEVNPHYLIYKKWEGAWMAVPLLLTAFSFQTMVPSLTPMLKGNIRGLRIAIIGGTVLAFVIYAIWQALILGIVPVEGPGGLREALEKGVPATIFLRQHVGGQWVVLVAEFFAFFAIVTSFLGIGLGLWDFLADGLRLEKKGWSKLLLAAIFLIPILICSTTLERIFYTALDATGGFGDTILNGIFPVLMVWIGRYHLKLPQQYRVAGGKPLLIMVGVLFTAALALEIYIQAGGALYNLFDVREILTPQELGIE